MNKKELAEALVKAYSDKKQTIVFAESCTGGLCADAVVSVAGASEIFFGSVVAYDNSIKRKILNVEKKTLDVFGAVSVNCAMQMAKGARDVMGTDVAVSVTGIAGPDGGTSDKPVGLVYIGVDSLRGTRAIKLNLSQLSERTAIRERSACEVLMAALEELKNI